MGESVSIESRNGCTAGFIDTEMQEFTCYQTVIHGFGSQRRTDPDMQIYGPK